MKVSAGVNAIVLGKAGDVPNLWYIRSHKAVANYTPN
jgi:hypothetical protein